MPSVNHMVGGTSSRSLSGGVVGPTPHNPAAQLFRNPMSLPNGIPPAPIAMAFNGGSSSPRLSGLFGTIEQHFHLSGFGSDRWYLLCAAALCGGNDAELCDQLYLYLIAKPEFSSPSQRRRLIRRLREALVKCVPLTGVYKPLEAIMAIAKHERPEDRDSTVTREGWRCDEDNLERGMAWMRRLYQGDTDATLEIVEGHGDFAWISKNITYGLYLSDRQVLDDLDTEVVALSAIMAQNLRLETHWHIRGMRRLGVPAEDVQVVWDSVQSIASFLGVKLSKVPKVEDVESEI